MARSNSLIPCEQLVWASRVLLGNAHIRMLGNARLKTPNMRPSRVNGPEFLIRISNALSRQPRLARVSPLSERQGCETLAKTGASEMAFWVVRAGKHGVNEDYTVENNAVVIGWEQVGDLSAISTKEAMLAHVQKTYDDAAPGSQRVWAGELWAFKERIQINEWVAVPLA